VTVRHGLRHWACDASMNRLRGTKEWAGER